ncbi:Spc97 / Spc98 family protein [Giardia muris]|uniref:Spc97 / Spc98 family protein n=1 Tax=Giardia muris TaxID=5742 RepID=A0A4Z1SRR4_GIAMU|nr:Spc97 / Spc98 family protein [Giardia muris]|eukprot:TNJ28614.1 Spc97 / Spc98 family protein [Giardia muris]
MTDPSDGRYPDPAWLPGLFSAACGIPCPSVQCALEGFTLDTNQVPLDPADLNAFEGLLDIGHGLFMLEAYGLLFAAVVNGSLKELMDATIDPELRRLFRKGQAGFKSRVPSRTLYAFSRGISAILTEARLKLADYFEPLFGPNPSRSLFLEVCILARHGMRHILSMHQLVQSLYQQAMKKEVLIKGAHLYNFLLNSLSTVSEEYDLSILPLIRPVATEVATMITSFVCNGFVSDPHDEFFAKPISQADALVQGVLDNTLNEFQHTFDREAFTTVYEKISAPTYISAIAPGCRLHRDRFPTYLTEHNAKNLVLIARCGRISGQVGEASNLLQELHDTIALTTTTKFSQVSFDRCVFRLTCMASRSLWLYLLQEGILDHLRILLDVAFLQQASLASCLFMNAQTALQGQVTPRLMSRAFNTALERALGVCYGHQIAKHLEFASFCEKRVGSRHVPLRHKQSVDLDALRETLESFQFHDLFITHQQLQPISGFQFHYCEDNPAYEVRPNTISIKPSTAEHLTYDPRHLGVEAQYEALYNRSIQRSFYEPERTVYTTEQAPRTLGVVYVPVANSILRNIVFQYQCSTTIEVFLAPHCLQQLSTIMRFLLAFKHAEYVLNETYHTFMTVLPSRRICTEAYGNKKDYLVLLVDRRGPSALGRQLQLAKAVPSLCRSLGDFLERLALHIELCSIRPHLTEFYSRLMEISRASVQEQVEYSAIQGYVEASNLFNSLIAHTINNLFLQNCDACVLLRFIFEMICELHRLVDGGIRDGTLNTRVCAHIYAPSREMDELYQRVVALGKVTHRACSEFIRVTRMEGI